MPVWIDALVALLLVFGSAFALIGSIGLVRLGDFYRRLHGPTKAVTLGVGCILIASMAAFGFGTGHASLHELLITLFLFLTAPISAHLLVRAALRLETRVRVPPPPR
ncbi:MAG: Na+/H+ antiporter subunit G [Gemmatimonadota bacterium]